MVLAVTISRQMGSLGNVIADALAERLGFRKVWREVINQAAIRSGAPEVALAVIDELGMLGLAPSPKTKRAYISAVASVMDELVEEGQVVIVGRAGQVILRDRAGVLHVQVIAPVELRVERIMKRHNISLEAARAQVEASDRYRRNYLRHYYQARWDDPLLYDLVINTEHLTAEEAADSVCAAVRCSSRKTIDPPGAAFER